MARADPLDDASRGSPSDLVGGEIVEDHGVACLQRRAERLGDVGCGSGRRWWRHPSGRLGVAAPRRAFGGGDRWWSCIGGHGAPRCGSASAAQASDVTANHVEWRPPSRSRKTRFGIEVGLGVEPGEARLLHIRAFLFEAAWTAPFYG